MSHPPKRGRSNKPKDLSDPARKAPAKKAYVSPSVVEYGSIAKLTQRGRTTGADLRGMMACL